MEPTLIKISFFKQTKKSVSISVSLCVCVYARVCACRCVHSTTYQCPCGDQRTTPVSLLIFHPETGSRSPLAMPCWLVLSLLGCSSLLVWTTNTHCYALTIPTRVFPLHSKWLLSCFSDKVLRYGLGWPGIQCLPATASVLGSRKTPHPARFLFVLIWVQI